MVLPSHVHTACTDHCQSLGFMDQIINHIGNGIFSRFSVLQFYFLHVFI